MPYALLLNRHAPRRPSLAKFAAVEERSQAPNPSPQRWLAPKSATPAHSAPQESISSLARYTSPLISAGTNYYRTIQATAGSGGWPQTSAINRGISVNSFLARQLGHLYCSFPALVLRKAFGERRAAAGAELEWGDIVRDLDRVDVAIADQGTMRIVLRVQAPDCAGVAGAKADYCEDNPRPTQKTGHCIYLSCGTGSRLTVPSVHPVAEPRCLYEKNSAQHMISSTLTRVGQCLLFVCDRPALCKHAPKITRLAGAEIRLCTDSHSLDRAIWAEALCEWTRNATENAKAGYVEPVFVG